MADNASYGSRRDLVNGRSRRSGAGNSQESGRPGQAMYQPGMPIGYMAARGTPYEKKYFTKKLGFCCLFLAPPIVIVTLVITLVPVLWAVAKHALATAQLSIESANITAPGNSSFPLVIRGEARRTGIFPAHLYFRKPVDVYWRLPPAQGLTELHLGTMKLAHIGTTSRGRGTVYQATTFDIVDEAGFGEFAKYLVSEEEFTWQLRCPEVHAEAFSFFPTYKSFTFTKNVVFKGINGFTDIKILDLQLPGDDPAGGITTVAVTSLTNPSPFGVAVGTLNLDLFYKGMYLGPVSTNNLNLTAGVNTVTIAGRLISHADNQTELDLLGELFTAYINFESSPVVAKGVSTALADGRQVTWLSTGLKALSLDIPFKAPAPIEPIKGISINYMNLTYNESLPFNPSISSNSLQGTFALPFGFSLNISRLATSLAINYQGAPVGSLDGDYADANTNLNVVNAGQTAGLIDLSLPVTTLVLPNTTAAAREELVKFQNAFTYADSAGFLIEGRARTITDTPLGRVLLNGIKFNVTTGLAGLAGLTKYRTIIQTVDVMGGAPDAVELAVGLSLVNPSNLNLEVGDATFDLFNRVNLGNATLPNLNLRIGRNDLQSSSFFDPNRDPVGLETLNRFISGIDTNLNITGSPRSSKVESLAPTFQGIRLNATLPGLKARLVDYAALNVLDTTGVTDDVALSKVALNNPFTSGLTITQIAANATAQGLPLATIGTGLNFPAAGKNTTLSPDIPLNVNLYPPDIFAVLRAFAVKANLNPAYIDGVVQLGGFTLSPTTPVTPVAQKRSVDGEDELSQMLMGVGANPGATADLFEGEEDDDDEDEEDETEFAKRALPLAGLSKRANLYTGFNLPDYVGRAFATATADLSIVSDARIGEYGTTLTFVQNDVPLRTDETLFKLLPVLAAPIVQKIVDGSILNIDRVTVTEARPTSFRAALQGALTNAGPFDGTVTFPDGLEIYYLGRLLTTTAFPNITLQGDVGSTINVELEAQIGDVPFFTQFLKDALLNPSFVWNIRGNNIVVDALGITVKGISLNKDVQLTGFNGLKGNVVINSFDVPANDPAGGITLFAQSTINNPAQLGVALTRFGTQIFGNDSFVGPAAAANSFTLQALAVTNLPLAGRLVPQTSQAGLDVLGNVFTNFVHNRPTTLRVRGDFAGPPDVAWLNEGIKVLDVDVSLPSQDFEVIRSISLNQLSLFFTVPTAYSPRTDSSNTTAAFFLPFTLPIDIKTVQGPFIANYQNRNMAVLNIPRSDTVTNVEARILNLMFQNVPFSVYDNTRQLFSQFLADTTAGESITFNLNGAATSDVATGAGTIVIRDIPFSLDTTIAGLQNLNARPATVSDLDVFRGFPTYLQINVNTKLFNPSQITIGAGDVQFSVLFMDRVIGTAQIKNILLVPGDNIVPTQILYSPQGAENRRAGQTLLENYVSNITSNAVVQGNSRTTPIPSLLQALSGIRLSTDIPSLMRLIVTTAYLTIPRDIAQTGVAQASVDLANPFTASLNIVRLQTDAVFQGITLGNINQDLSRNPIRAPGKQTTRSQDIPINLNIDPKNLIRFILAAAASAGVSLGPLPPFFQKVLDLQDTRTPIVPFPDDAPPPCNSGRAFDTLGAILALLRPLTTTLNIRSTVLIDEYQTDLNFVQEPVPTRTDETALYLVGPAAAPLIQIIVDESVLLVNRANATNLNNAGFFTSLAGALNVNTPADAYIEFPDPISIEWQGSKIANIALPPICAGAPDGVPDLRSAGQLTITNEGRFTDFAEFLLKNPSFQWRLTSDTVVVRTLGIRFSKVTLDKTIQLDAFDGLKSIVVKTFGIPSQGPGARLNLAITADITSPASLGVELGDATFDTFFQGTLLGPITARNLFLAAKAVTSANIDGFLGPQSGQGLVNLGILFSQYLAGQNSTLTIRGKEVVSNGQQVRWLTNAFRRFETTTVLPGMKYDIVFGITLSDLTATILDPSNSYRIKASNNETLATFANPFNFDLTPIDVKTSATIVFGGSEAAQLNLPLAPVVRAGTSSGPEDREQIVINFRNQDVTAINNGAFEQFFRAVAVTPQADFRLRGSIDVRARTVIGNPLITGIPFDVPSSLKGIDSFGRVTQVSNVNIDDATRDYVGIHVDAALDNPSQVRLISSDFLLPLLYDNTEVARVSINPADFVPGQNNFKVLVQLLGRNTTATTEFIRLYLEPSDQSTARLAQTSDVVITGQGRVAGDPPLSPYASLGPALTDTILRSKIPGLGTLIVKAIRAYLTLDGVLAGLPSLFGTNPVGKLFSYAYLDVENELPIELSLTQISTTLRGAREPDGAPYAIATVNFPNNFILPPAPRTGVSSGRITSPKLDNIELTRGLLGSLTLIGQQANIDNWITASLTGPSGTFNGLPIHYGQRNIPLSVFLGFGGDAGIPLGSSGVPTPEQLIGGLLQILKGNDLTKFIEALTGQIAAVATQQISNDVENLVKFTSSILPQEVKQTFCVLPISFLDILNVAGCRQTATPSASPSASPTPSPAAASPNASPAAGTPAANTPAANTPAANTPAANTPAANTPAADPPSGNRVAASSTAASSAPAAGTNAPVPRDL